MKRNTRGMHFITRIDYDNIQGYLVRFMVHGEQLMNKLFSDGVYGGKRLALYEAKILRNACLDIINDNKEIHCHTILSPRNKTGVIGVTRYSRKNSKHTPLRHSYSASYYPNKGEKITKGFAVLKYGEDKALQLAIQFRMKSIGNLGAIRNKIRREFKNL